MPSSSMCRRRGSITPGRLLVALLAASAGGARAARVRAAARLSAGAHRLLDGLLGAPSAAAPPGPAEAAAAVVDFLRAGGAGGGGNATAAARPACAGFLARSLGGLNESWSDVQLEAALNSTCSERALFTKAKNTRYWCRSRVLMNRPQNWPPRKRQRLVLASSGSFR
ncbi:unnamed protein product [Prorocentrum cordatum]|uniref:Uncharacterized protein n=1 Tax=Prorocentrum cordatum TaxID=2364126 RepID=A0ABN9VWZ7_9DINO|nr:unnamed protein product [Polarella glacialis]